ncbi:MAG TPA: hypothetical protein PK257_02555 [Candidatus Woesebacteria bacterium]|nr:hypothetical protein [Candidatus Woesebacteria bacterium]
MKKALFRVVTFLFLALPVYLTFFANGSQIKSAPVNSLKDQLSTAQLSFFGRLSSANGSTIKINTIGSSAPSIITANLATGDTIVIANAGVTTVSTYIVRNIGDTASIELSTAIGTTTPNAYVIATRSAVHTVSFVPQSSTGVGETWQFLIKATNLPGELPADGIPDQGGFDLGKDVGSTTTGPGTALKVADITCPLSGTASVGTTVFISSGVNIGSTGTYHVIQCSGNASTVGVGISMVIGRDTYSKLINPAPGINHVPGQATGTVDAYNYAIRQIDTFGNVIDTTFGKLAVTESVRVTAIVDPTITFTIGSSNTTSIGTSRCGLPISNGAPETTATSVNFGPLVLGTYNNLAQSISCTTNSANGYVIQAFENQVMTTIGTTGAGGVGLTIPNTTCEGTGCTPTAQRAWTAYTNSGFGYSLEVGVTTGTTASIGITTVGHYKPFGIGFANAQPILSRTNTPTGTDSIYVCYRAVASTTQQAGTYENQISYIATATF